MQHLYHFDLFIINGGKELHIYIYIYIYIRWHLQLQTKSWCNHICHVLA